MAQSRSVAAKCCALRARSLRSLGRPSMPSLVRRGWPQESCVMRPGRRIRADRMRSTRRRGPTVAIPRFVRPPRYRFPVLFDQTTRCRAWLMPSALAYRQKSAQQTRPALGLGRVPTMTTPRKAHHLAIQCRPESVRCVSDWHTRVDHRRSCIVSVCAWRRAFGYGVTVSVAYGLLFRSKLRRPFSSSKIAPAVSCPRNLYVSLVPSGHTTRTVAPSGITIDFVILTSSSLWYQITQARVIVARCHRP